MLLLALVAVPAHHEALAGAVARLLVAAVVGHDSVQVAGANYEPDNFFVKIMYAARMEFSYFI